MARLILFLCYLALALMLYIFVRWSADPETFYPLDSPEAQGNTMFEDWIPYEDQEGGFAIKLPTLPIRSDSTSTVIGGTVRYRLYSASGPRTDRSEPPEFAINVITYPPSMPIEDPLGQMQAILDSTLTGTYASEQRQAVSGTRLGYPSMEFHYIGSSTEASGILVTRGQQIYFLLYLTRRAEHLEEMHRYYVESFSLLNP